MERLKELAPYFALLLTVITGAFGYGKLRQRVEDMEKEQSRLYDELEKLNTRNSLQHEKLFDLSRETNESVARIEGLLSILSNDIITKK